MKGVFNIISQPLCNIIYSRKFPYQRIWYSDISVSHNFFSGLSPHRRRCTFFLGHKIISDCCLFLSPKYFNDNTSVQKSFLQVIQNTVILGLFLNSLNEIDIRAP
jgi:hypothetical protein